MVNYSAIADAAQVYPDYQAAFSAMSIEMGADSYKDLSPHYLKMWAAMNGADYLALKSGTDALSMLAVSMIELESETLKVSDPAVHVFINALSISQASKDAIFAMATKTNKAWPNLKEGHVQNAMQKRAEGTV